MDPFAVAAGTGIEASKSLTFLPDAAGVAHSYHAMSQLVADYKRALPREGMAGFTTFDRSAADGKVPFPPAGDITGT